MSLSIIHSHLVPSKDILGAPNHLLYDSRFDVDQEIFRRVAEIQIGQLNYSNGSRWAFEGNFESGLGRHPTGKNSAIEANSERQ